MGENQPDICAEVIIDEIAHNRPLPAMDPELFTGCERSRVVEYVLGSVAVETEGPNVEQRQRLAARRLAILGHAETAYSQILEDPHSTVLWDNQVEPYAKTLQFLAQTGPDVKDQSDLTRKGYLELPTAYGKTAITSKILEAMGVGKTPEQDGQPIKALYLVPTRPILEKSASSKGLAKFFPDLKATMFYGRVKDLDGDVVVMTYQSLRQKKTTQMLQKYAIDIVVCDEAHTALSKENREAVKSIIDNKIVLGFTATSSYGPNRSLRSLLGHEIMSKDVRDSVLDGDVNGAQLIGLWTGTKLALEQRSSEANDFTDKELHPLVQHAERNNLILDMAIALVEQGRNVVIPSIGGSQNLHARILEQFGSRRIVTDPITGKQRPLIVRAVDLYSGNVANVLKQWESGEIDVLTYTDVLNQGWDSERVDAMIMARPTTSTVLGRQRVGRGLRKSKQNPLTVYVELFDDIEGQPLYTIFHNFGEDIHSFAQVYAKNPLARQRQLASCFDLSDLPASVQRANSQLDLAPIRESIITAIEGRYPEAPKDWQPIPLLAAEQQIWSTPLRNYLEKHGFKCEVFSRKAAPYAYFAPPEAVAFLNTQGLPPVAPEAALGAKQIAVNNGVTRERIVRGVQVLKITGKEYRSRKQGRIHTYYSRQQQAKLHAWLQETMIEESEEQIPVKTLEQELGIGRESIRYFLGAKDQDITFASDKRTGIKTGFLTTEQARMVRERFGIEAAPPEDVESLRSIGERAGCHRLPRVRTIVKELGLEGKVRKYRHKPPGKKNAIFDTFLDSKNAELVLKRIRETAQPPNTITVNAYVANRNCSTNRVMATIKKHQLPVTIVDRGSNKSHYLPPRTEYALDKLYGMALPAWYSREKAVDIIGCRDEEFEAILGHCQLRNVMATGEEQIITTPAVEKLVTYSPQTHPFHRGWKNCGDMRTALLALYNAELPFSTIHQHIWEQAVPKARQFMLFRGPDGMLQFHYEPEFANSLLLAMRNIKA